MRIAVPIMNHDFHVGEDGVKPHIGDQLFLVRKRVVVEEEDIYSP
jgi:hypothetical protein